MKHFEVVVIGAGPGGYQAALELGKASVKTLLIDKAKENIGGTCLNVGCIPTKSYLESASFISKIPHLKQMGVDLDFKGLNLKQLRDKTIALKNEIRTGVLWMLEQSKVEIIYGTASFIDTKTIKLNDENISFDRCIIATGSKVRELPQLPIDSKYIISSNDIFNLLTLPKSITIIGVGAIACEVATFFNAFNVDVTLIGRSNRLLPNEDEDVSKALSRVFKRLNIDIKTSTTIAKAELNEKGVKLLFNETQENIQSELVLSAVGRVPYSDGLNLKNADIKQDEKGFIKVNPSFLTSQEHIYAIGDCIDTTAFAHTAYKEAKIVTQNIIANESKTNTHIIPSTIFTNPQIASCGLKEKDAKEQNIEVEIKKAYYKVNARAKIHGDDSGFAKVVISAKSGVILGATIIGIEATEIIQELVFAVEKKITITELREVIHAHPTVSEIITYL